MLRPREWLNIRLRACLQTLLIGVSQSPGWLEATRLDLQTWSIRYVGNQPLQGFERSHRRLTTRGLKSDNETQGTGGE
ncbi:hypothetical protein BDV18DRAFT_49929 [Aspergillus unguis]